MQAYRIKRKISQFVDTVAFSRVKQFYPSAAAKYAQVPLNVAFEALLQLVIDGELIIKWELRCPNDTCIRRIELSNDKAKADSSVFCPYCGIEFDASPGDYFPVFEVTDQFKADIYEEKKTNIRPYLQLAQR